MGLHLDVCSKDGLHLRIQMQTCSCCKESQDRLLLLLSRTQAQLIG